MNKNYRGWRNEGLIGANLPGANVVNKIDYSLHINLYNKFKLVTLLLTPFEGSGCGAVGRAVAYDTRVPEFESSHWQLLLKIYLLLTICRKDENKEKRPGMAHF